jgi:NAD(P)-dependent dehydrogenase (short-subunit alcohol dehydrogenase family)
MARRSAEDRLERQDLNIVRSQSKEQGRAMSTELRFDGLTAVVTGAGRGLGRSYALLLAARGARVVVNDVGGSGFGDPSDVVAEILQLGGSAIPFAGSVADPSMSRGMVAAAVDAYGSLDIVINNAGIQRFHSIADSIDDDVEREWRVHLFGALALTQAAWPLLQASGSAAIVNTSSGIGLFGFPDAASYGSAKMGVIGLTRNLALEGAADGIRVNAIAPMAKTVMAGDDWGSVGERLSPELVAPVVAWLAHPSCELTGQVLSAGGGRVARVAIEVAEGSFCPDLTLEDVARLSPEFMSESTFPRADALAEGDIVEALHARFVG